MNQQIGLRYVAEDGRWLPGVPARDLTPEEVAEHGEEFLLSVGIYAKPTPGDNKQLTGPSENKQVPPASDPPADPPADDKKAGKD